MTTMDLDESVISERLNAVTGWVLTTLLLFGSVENLLAGALLWSGLWLLLVVLVSFPELATRDWRAMVP